MAAAKARGGVIGNIKRVGLMAAAGLTFARLYLLRARRSAIPLQIRLAPAW
jgi:magnesium-protoporphyrin IX monomethyl ester (oxidative) cyclase